MFVQSKIDVNEKIKSKHIIHYISSKTGEGIDNLFEKIYEKISLSNQVNDANVSRERHRIILKNTLKYLKLSLEPKNLDIFAEDIRLSLFEISKITGKKDIEEILDIIFSDFCIGK